MSENKLMPFQENGIRNVAISQSKHTSTCAVSPGGSGKAIMMATVAYRRVQKFNRKVCVFVNSDILLSQFREKLFSWYGFVSQKVDADTKIIDKSNLIFSCMVQTYVRRMDNPQFCHFFDDCDLLIIDEVHIGNFNAIYPRFPCNRIGFTATPKAAQKINPLNKFFEDIVIIATQEDMIELNKEVPNMGCVPSLCYSLGGIDRSQIKMKGQEFDEDDSAIKFKSQIKNTVDSYLKKSYGKKTLVFNCNIEDSIDTHNAFLEAGLNSRHLDSKKNGKYGSDSYRKNTLDWFHKTPDAILHNVGILTTGFDEPSIETVIIKKCVASLPYWIQMVVRGSRPYRYQNGEYKEFFTLLDMGNNAKPEGGNLGDCNSNQEWEYIFNNPKLPSPGVAPIKTCPKCAAMNNVSSRICKGLRYDFLSGLEVECLYIFPVTEKEEDLIPRELVLLFKDGIDVKKNIEYFQGRNHYFIYFETLNQIANMAFKTVKNEYLDSIQLDFFVDLAYSKCTELFKLGGYRKFPNFRDGVKNELIKKLKEKKFIINVEELEMLK